MSLGWLSFRAAWRKQQQQVVGEKEAGPPTEGRELTVESEGTWACPVVFQTDFLSLATNELWIMNLLLLVVR